MDTTSKNKTDNATNGTLLILLTIQYFLRVQFLHYVLQCFFYTVMYLENYNSELVSTWPLASCYYCT